MAHDADDVAKVLAYGREQGIPVTFRAGGTSLNGQGQSDGILVDVRRHFGGVAVERRTGAAAPGSSRARARPRQPRPRPARAQARPRPGQHRHRHASAASSPTTPAGCAAASTKDSYSTVRALTFVLPSGTTIDTAAPGAAERFAAAEPELAAGLAAIRDEIRADAELSERIRRKFAIKNTTGYRLCAFLDADEPLEIFRRLAGRLRGHARLRRRGGLRDRAAAGRTTTAWVHFPGHRRRRSPRSASWSRPAPPRSS